MILGIVLLVLFGLVFFISRQTSDMMLEKNIDKIYSDFLSSSNIKHVTESCLDKVTKDALLLIGLQGGRIYDYQINGGYHTNSFYDVVAFNYTANNPRGVIYNVSYGIKAPVNIPYPNPPNYPYPGFLTDNISKLLIPNFFKNPNEQLFANVPEKNRFTILPDLCNKMGPNDPYIKGMQVSCETYSVKNESIEEYIKKYIGQNVESCINFVFDKTKGYTVSMGNVTPSVLIGEDDLLVSLIYPLEISVKNKPPTTRYLDFSIRPKIRLKRIYEIASHLIGYNSVSSPSINPPKADSNNIFFDTLNNDPRDCYRGRDPCIVPGIKISRLNDYCINNANCNFADRHYRYSDILVIEDNQSIINGKPYRFQFAIENRRPALDFIDESVNSNTPYYSYVSLNYGKDITQVYNGPGYSISNNYNIVSKKGSILYIYALGLDPDEENLRYTYIIPSGQLIAQPSQKEVWINTGGVGSFNVRINVSDSEGLYDYQDVVVKVVD